LIRLSARVVAAALIGALVGTLALGLACIRRPQILVDMNGNPPPFVSGLYPGERAGDLTFAWSRERVTVRLPGLDRRQPWTCTIALRGARADAAALPTVGVVVDGLNTASIATTNDFADTAIPVPARSDRAGATIVLTIAPTFRPGGGDPRELGVQIDRIACAPDRGWAWPPAQALRAAAGATAAFGAALALAGGGMATALIAIVALAVGLAELLSRGGAAFGSLPSSTLSIVLATAVALVLIARALTLARRAPLSAAAIAALATAAVAGDLQWLALLHPSKAVVDALFQAHRLEWVMNGRYFFTQPMPDGVAFPYAIGLYVFAMPWATMFPDHVALLRGIVSIAGAIAAGLLFVPVSRGWRDGIAATLAVLFAFLPPLPYVVVGNGNLPNAFGQSIALIGLVLIASGVAGMRARWAGLALVAILTLALTSHVSTVTLLLPALGVIAVGFWLAGRAFRRDAVVLVVTTAVAFALAVGLYYRHFTDVYREAAARVLSPASAVVAPPPARDGMPDRAVDERTVMLVRQLTWSERARDALSQSIDAVGWPLLLLAFAGAIRTWRAGWRDRLSIVAIALAIVWGVLVLAGTFLHVGTQYQRYASEFMGRVCLATYPAIVLFAARGAAWPWAPDARMRWARLLSITLSAAALAIGARAWLGWFW
jgi:hypothetical protein